MLKRCNINETEQDINNNNKKRAKNEKQSF